MRWVAVVACLAFVACEQPHEPPPIVGEKPIECGPPLPPEEDDVNLPSGPATVIRMPLPLIDPDCTSAITLQRSTTAVLVWSEGANTQVEPIPATIRSTWRRMGSECHARITIDHLGGPRGRSGSIQPCHAEILSDTWASFADVPIVLGALSVEGADVALTGPLAWRGIASTTTCDEPSLESTALSLSVSAEVRVSLADWRRLHSLNPPTLAVEVVIGMH